MSIVGFSNMPDIVVLSGNILYIALWVENPRWPPFDQGQTINWYIFRQNRSRLTILVSTIGFSGMTDLVVGLEITLDIALLVKSKMADICPRSNNILDIIKSDSWYFSHTSGVQVCDYLSTMRFSYIPGQVVWSESIAIIALRVKS